MKIKKIFFTSVVILFFARSFAQSTLTGEQVLNNELRYPLSIVQPIKNSSEGFAGKRLSKVPKSGIHPRVLFSPSDIPDINYRLENTEVGKKINKLIQEELDSTVRLSTSAIYEAINTLAAGDIEGYKKIESQRTEGNSSFTNKAFQNSVILTLRLEALDCLLKNDKTRGEKAAAAIASWAKALEPEVKKWRKSLFSDDASRWGSWHALGSFALFATHHLGDAYDVSYKFMNEAQRNQTRSVIASITNGTYTFAMRLPHQLRSWNWVNFSNCLPVLALSIEGEKGYDKRVYDKGVEVMRDYILNNYSKAGSSTEAIGYTSGGWKDGVPAVLAFARREDNLMLMDRYQSIKNWQLNVMLPHEGEWLNHGDLGNYPVGFHEIQLMKYFFPGDAIIDYNYQQALKVFQKRPSDMKEMLFEAAILAVDANKTPDGKNIDYQQGAKLNQPLDFHDEERGNLVARTAWNSEALQLNFECRPDGFYAGHEHADRGNFNISALGRLWTPESPRSPQSKYHSVVLVDGKGQGFFTPPGKWLGITQSEKAVFGTCDAKYAYDWFWPKAIVSVDTNSVKFKAERFSMYRAEAVDYQNKYKMEKDPHPNVISRFKGFDLGDSGMWDEDPWPVRIAYNPVEYAFRSAGLIRGKHSYVLVVDDIQKDQNEHLYEWNMMVSNDLDVISIREEDAAQNFLGPRVMERTTNFYTDIILGSNNIPHKNGEYKPVKGEPLLLVRVLQKSEPSDVKNYESRPNPRLETIEKKDDFSSPGVHLGPGGRTWGIAKRLIVPSKSVNPQFKVMIYPFRFDIDPLPKTDFSDKSNLKVEWSDQKDVFQFTKGADERTRFVLKQDDKTILELK